LAFYQQWVRKEAFAKAQGTGLASSLIHLRKPADRMDQMGSDPEVGDDPVRMIEVGADHVGAIATVGARPKLEFYDAAPFLACEATT
jgi:phosphopantetheinyl transferase